MPCGISVSAYNKHRRHTSGYHRLYAVWYFSFCLQQAPATHFGIPPALCRVVFQFLPTTSTSDTLQDTTGFIPSAISLSAYNNHQRHTLRDHAPYCILQISISLQPTHTDTLTHTTRS